MLRIATAKGKFALLKRRLGAHYKAIGALEGLWHITATNHPDGGIGRMSDEEIEACLEWDGKPGELVAALLATRWLDRVEGEARLYVHDWHHHADETTHRKIARERLYFANGDPPNTNYLPLKERAFPESFYRSDAPQTDSGPNSVAISRDESRLDRAQFSSGQGQRAGAEGSQEETAALAADELTPLDPALPEVGFARDFALALVTIHGNSVKRKIPAEDTKTFRKRWVGESRLLFDDVGEPCARNVAKWLFKSADPNANFWRSNVLSVSKFRQQFPTLRMQSEQLARASPRAVRGGGAEDALASLGKRLGFEVTG